MDDVRTLYDQVVQYHQEKMTDFLNRREQEIMKTIIGKDEAVDLCFFGGSAQCERKRAVLRPSYLKDEQCTWSISILGASFSSKFVNIAHRDVLGALMQVGLERRKFGDIFVADNQCMFACVSEVEGYVRSVLTRIAQVNVELSPLPLSAFIGPPVQWDERHVTVSSLRIDTMVAVIYSLSRAKAVTAIGKGLVKVNDCPIEKANVHLYVGDEISVRGLGRAKFLQAHGLTKKDRVRVVIGRRLT
ncbi:RNA-binding protein [Shouchella lonarensis]|uniref:YlmH family RNA-binding protein n=1 Tax=Shouchella lonarensis TaxID=1464122 RepID=UPI001FE11FF5|nr:YlmH/Sll1252 family protein [Shouchella lonarensis]